MRCSPPLRALPALGLALGLISAPAAAELVVLSTGDVVKVSDYEVGERTVRLTLPSGGRLTLPLLRVERILEDEIVRPDPALASPDRLALRYRDDALPEGTPYAELIREAALRNDVNPRLVAAMMFAESAFDRRAVSHKGARGLLQLMPATAARFGVAADELFEPGRNLEAGTRYLSWLIDRFGEGDAAIVLAAYNAGEGAVERHGGVPPYRETQGYVRKILARLDAVTAPVGAVATTAALR